MNGEPAGIVSWPALVLVRIQRPPVARSRAPRRGLGPRYGITLAEEGPFQPVREFSSGPPDSTAGDKRKGPGARAPDPFSPLPTGTCSPISPQPCPPLKDSGGKGRLSRFDGSVNGTGSTSSRVADLFQLGIPTLGRRAKCHGESEGRREPDYSDHNEDRHDLLRLWEPDEAYVEGSAGVDQNFSV
jgi:hypothetical protein